MKRHLEKKLEWRLFKHKNKSEIADSFEDGRGTGRYDHQQGSVSRSEGPFGRQVHFAPRGGGSNRYPGRAQ